MAGSLLGDLLQRGEDLPWSVLGQESLREEGEGGGGDEGDEGEGEGANGKAVASEPQEDLLIQTD